MKVWGASVTTIAAFCAGLIGAGRAQAQDSGYHAIKRDRSLSVRERPKPEYDPLGVDVGAFRLYPELQLSGQSTNNVFAAPSPDEQEETVTRARLSARLDSEWSNHQLSLYGSGTALAYEEFSDNDTTSWTGGLASRIDVTRDTKIYFDANAQHAQETPMTTPSDQIVTDFVEYDQSNLALSLVQDFANVRVAAGVRQIEFDYEDGALEGGGVLEADDRDHTVQEASLRADVAISPGFGFFVEGRVNQREFELLPPDVSINRNSEGYHATAGISFEATNVIQGELGVGQYSQSYEAVGQEDSEGASAYASIEWQPDELVSVNLGVDREVAGTGAFNAVSEVRDNAELSVDYEFRRNMILGLGVSSTRAAYEGIDREDERSSARATLDWQFNRAAGLTLGFEHYEQSSDGAAAGREFEVDQATITFRLRR